jgi:hypothetical protein
LSRSDEGDGALHREEREEDDANEVFEKKRGLVMLSGVEERQHYLMA